MTTYNIDYNLAELNSLVKAFANTVENAPEAALPNTATAFGEAVHYVHNLWTGYLTGDNDLDGIEHLDNVTSAMVQSIRTRKNGAFDYTISSDNRQLEQAVKGRKEVEYDMKKTHPYGNKSRVSRKGIPYLIIPFRWGTPNKKGTKRAHFNNFIPQKIYNVAVKGTNISFVKSLKDHIEKNARGEDIWRWGYEWVKGSRLSDDLTASDDRMKGMVRMLDDRRKDVRDSVYFTFRIISAKSPSGSWIYHRDGKPGIDLIGALERTARPHVEKLIEEGVNADADMFRKM